MVVLTQACDLAQKKATRSLVAVVHDAQRLVDRGILRSAVVRDQIRSHRVYGWYFLPAGTALAESVVDLRDLHTIPRHLLERLAQEGKRVCRIATPCREHLAQHFATTYSRIGLPLGRLPGDISYKGKNVSFYFPLGTSILISVVLSALLYLLSRFRR